MQAGHEKREENRTRETGRGEGLGFHKKGKEKTSDNGFSGIGSVLKDGDGGDHKKCEDNNC